MPFPDKDKPQRPMKIVRVASQKEVDMVQRLVDMGLEVKLLGGRSPKGDRYKYRGVVSAIDLRKGEIWITLDPIVNQPRVVGGYKRKTSRIWEMPRIRSDYDELGWFMEIG